MRIDEFVDGFGVYYEVEPNTGCWLWLRAVNWAGYGDMWCEKEHWLAHRFSYTLFNGPIPDGMYVLHKCDCPGCINPNHLFVGSQDDNMKDAARKGRMERGSSRPLSVLSEDDVREILSLGGAEIQKNIAKRFGTDPSNISRILSGKYWKHIYSEVSNARGF